MNKTNIEWREASKLLKECDILLFRNKSLFGRLISVGTEGEYSHAALVTQSKCGKWEVVEFKEWKGGRVVDLARYIDDYNGSIDVYRCDGSYIRKFYNPNSNDVEACVAFFLPLAITNCMRSLTGLPYGWRRIWWIIKHKFYLLRLFSNQKYLINDMPSNEIIYPVCSTAISHCFNQYGFDLQKHRSDSAMSPNDLARSPILNYLFTLTP
jgi:hypothetical protein